MANQPVTGNAAKQHSFVDFEIRIFQRQRQEERYPVEITLGEQQEFPRGYLSADILPWVPGGDPTVDGKKLFEALFADSSLREAWAEAQGQSPQRRIRLRIDPAAAELHALPWELMLKETMLSAQVATPFSRYLPIALPWGGPVEERPIRVLAVISDPTDIEEKFNLPKTDVAVERETIESAFAEISSDTVQVDFLEAPVTLERLEERLREPAQDGSGYHILHYTGHGAFSAKRQQAVLYMQDENGLTQLVSDNDLAHMLARQGVRPRLVALVACQSASSSPSGSESHSTGDAFVGLAPKLVSVGVPAVVAMQDLITVESALKFSAAFYRQLLAHGQVDLAVNEARSTLLSAGRHDAAIPVLFMRLKSGQLWGDEADARGEVLGTRNPRIFWTGLIRMIQQGKCTPILGPRVYGRWLPRRSQIARIWADMHDYPFTDSGNLTRVAQYLASNQGQDFPRYELLDTAQREFLRRLPEELRPTDPADSLTEMVHDVGWEALTGDDPNEIHRVLSELDLPLYLTTNFCNFMTEALAAQGKQPTREICRWNEMLDWLPSRFEDDPNYAPTPESPLVYHLFGSDEEPDSLVLTEDDYLDFLVHVSAVMARIPNYIWAALANSSLMFLGYSLYDWEFRVIMRGLVATREQRRRFKHVAVQLEVDDVGHQNVAAVQHFLQQYFQDAEINVFWGSVQQFAAELREQREASTR